MRQNKSRLYVGPVMVDMLERRCLFSVYLIDSAATLAVASSANLEPGDQVLFKGSAQTNGTLTLGPEDVGTAANPILISSYDPTTGLPIAPNAPASARGTLFSGNAIGVNALNAYGIDLVAVNVVGSGRTVNTTSGVSFGTNLAGNVKLDHVTIDLVDVSGYKFWGVTVGGTVAKSGFTNVRITNVVSHDNGQGGIETHGLFSSSSTLYANTNVYIGYCTVYNNTGIAGFSTNSGNGIVPSDVDGCVIEYSVAHDNGILNTHVGGPVGIWTWDANNVTIQFNESYHNRTASSADGGGFDLDGGVTNSVIQYCYSHDNDGPGYGIYQFSGARPMHDNVVRYNISVNDARENGAAIDLWSGVSNGLVRTAIFNNTVYITPTAGNTPQAVLLASGTTNTTFRNNIFATTGGVQLVKVSAGKSQPGLLFQGNNYWTYGGSFLISWDRSNYTSLGAFRTGQNQETLPSGLAAAVVKANGKSQPPPPPSGTPVGYSVDPLFVNRFGTTAADFMLQSSSPMKNAGLNLQTLFGVNPGIQDYFGDSIPQDGAYDIGADEIVTALA